MEGSGLPERGARRRKIAGYLRAANELRQSYQQQYGLSGWSDGVDEDDSPMPGGFPDASVVRNGNEEMLLFPSYAKHHRKRKQHPAEMPGANNDLRDTEDTGDAEYWKRQWDKYEDENAIVDVDIRGWIYAPQKSQMTRKNRLLVGIARHLSGIPAPVVGQTGSRTPSPRPSLHGKMEAHNMRKEEELAEQEADSLKRGGQRKADVASRGGFSESPSNEADQLSPYSSPSQSRSASPSRTEYAPIGPSRPITSASLGEDQDVRRPTARRSATNQTLNANSEELSIANANLMLRLKPFLTTPLVQTPLTVFFYNDDTSQSRTTNTDESGHFQLRAPLDFIPTHVRVLASDQLSATEEVHITDSMGVSVISDIDDTIKHSAIGSGAREIFRNAFVRDLSDLTIDGVQDWYSKMADTGAKMHYVSNAPWQLYPVLVEFFAKAGLPRGSFHLKQYSGMLQGIFEPVAERKKGTLDKIMNDFPERQFILVGDSGEADLELYTEILLGNPGRILGVFIRDVTTTRPQGTYEAAGRPRPPRLRSHLRSRSRDSTSTFSKPSTLMSSQADTPPPTLPPRPTTRTASSLSTPTDDQEGPKLGTLIDFDEEPTYSTSGALSAVNENGFEAKSPRPPTAKSPPPSLPSKPLRLRSPSNEQPIAPPPTSQPITRKPLPPLPPKPRQYTSFPDPNAPSEPSPLSQTQMSSPPRSRDASQDRQSYRAAVRNKVSSAYNALPSLYPVPPTARSSSSTILPRSSLRPTSHPASDGSPTGSYSGTGHPSDDRRPPPPIPPRRTNTSSQSSTRPSYSTTSNGTATNNPSLPPSSNPPRPSPPTSNPNYDPDSSLAYGNDDTTDPIISKKEELWLRRWDRAKEIFKEQGVMLRSWRVGADVEKDALRLVERAMSMRDRNRDRDRDYNQQQQQQRRGEGDGTGTVTGRSVEVKKRST